MPKYTLEIGGKTYDFESAKPLSDQELAGYARQIAGERASTMAPPGQIPGAGPYQAPPEAPIPVGRRLAQGVRQNVSDIARFVQPSAEALAAAGGAIRGGAAMAPAGPVAAAGGALAGGLTSFLGARAGSEVLQGQQPDLRAGAQEYALGEMLGQGLGKAVRLGARAVDTLRSSAQRSASNIARQAAGDQLGAIKAGLAAAEPGTSPAQATAELPRQAWQALLAFEPTDFSAQLARNRRALAEEELARMAGGRSQTESRRAQEEAQATLNALVAPMRETELGAANQAGQTMARLGPQAAAKQQSMVSALQQSGRTATEAAQRGEAAAQQMQRAAQTGRIPTVSATQAARAQGAAANQWQETADVFADVAKRRRSERDFIERQIGSLEAYGLKPLSIDPLLGSIDRSLNTPGLRASNDLTKVLGLVRDDLVNLAQRNGGVIDAHDLYTIRKEGVAQRVRDVLKIDDPKAGAKLTASVLDKLRPVIDNAIETAAGGPGWRQYLQTYSQGMDVIAQKQMAAQALEMFKDSPQQFVKLVRGDNKDAVEAIFGPGRYDVFKEMSAQMPTLDKLARQVEMDKRAAELAEGGKKDLALILEANRSKLRLPNWFQPAITATNLSLASANKRLDKKTVEVLRKAAETNQSMLDLLNGLPEKERRKLLDIVIDTQRRTGEAKRAAAVGTVGEVERQRNALSEQPVNALTE
jgi:hypothetical protein